MSGSVPRTVAPSGGGLAIARGAALARAALGAALAVGGLAILGFAAQGDMADFLRIASLGLLLAGAGLGAGALLGFIFAVPRTQDRAAAKGRPGGFGEGGDSGVDGPTGIDYRGNTNLEQISDWLTKILVGVSLTQYREISSAMRRLVDFLAPGLARHNDPASARSLVFALLVFAPVCGFLLSYILTRIYFAVALRKADAELSLASFRPAIDIQVTDLRRAILPQLARSAAAPPPGLREQVRVLATEFENLRAALPPGEERTRRCESVAAQMRSLSLVPGADDLARTLMRSDSPGERLAAIAILQVMPQGVSLAWLADRVASDQPFIGYHAALALVYAARAMTEERPAFDERIYLPDLLRAVRTARLLLGGDLAGTDRDFLISEAERLLRPFARS